MTASASNSRENHRRVPPGIRVILILCPVLAAAGTLTPASLILTVNGYESINSTSPGGRDDFLFSFDQTSALPLSYANHTPTAAPAGAVNPVNAEMSGSVAVKHLTAYAFAQTFWAPGGSGLGLPVGSGGSATAEVRDNLMLVAPVAPGTLGTWTFTMDLDGSAQVGAVGGTPITGGCGTGPCTPPTSQAYSQLYFYVFAGVLGTSHVASVEGYKSAATAGSGPGGWSPIVTMTVDIPFNQEFLLVYHIQALAGAASNTLSFSTDNAFARSDISHTMNWGGTNSLTFADGTPVTNYSLISASGADYLTPFATAAPQAPEPGTLMLPAVPLAALAAMRRKRKGQLRW